MNANYKYIAWIYDWLANLVFGNKLELAKRAFISDIPEGAKILVVGGGTGSIIEYLALLNKHLHVDFVEQSKYMIGYAKKRNVASLEIAFYNQSILDLNLMGYDVVITNFFFDQFNQTEAKNILQHIRSKLNPSGVIIFSDFIHTNHRWDKFVIWFMFVFFRLTTTISANALSPFSLMFTTLGFHETSSRQIGRTIRAATYVLEPIN